MLDKSHLWPWLRVKKKLKETMEEISLAHLKKKTLLSFLKPEAFQSYEICN